MSLNFLRVLPHFSHFHQPRFICNVIKQSTHLKTIINSESKHYFSSSVNDDSNKNSQAKINDSIIVDSEQQTLMSDSSNTTDIQKKNLFYDQYHKADDDQPIEFAVNISGIFLASGFLTGLLIVYFAPKDISNNFQFHSPFPYLYHHRRQQFSQNKTKNDQKKIENTANESTIAANKIFDDSDFAHSLVFCFATAALYSICGRFWWNSWTSPLRKKVLKPVQLIDALTRMSKYSFRNALHGGLIGSSFILFFIFSSIFFSYYRFFSHFLHNKYLDENYLAFKEKEYSSILSRYEEKYRYSENEMISAIQNERSFRIATPSLNYGKYKTGTTGIKSTSKSKLIALETRPGFKPIHIQFNQQKSLFDEAQIELMRKQWLWNMNIYYNSSLKNYKNLSEMNEEEKWMRYAMGKEIGKLAVFSTFYIIVPIYFGTCFVTASIYRRLWKRLSERIINKMEKRGFLDSVNYITY